MEANGNAQDLLKLGISARTVGMRPAKVLLWSRRSTANGTSRHIHESLTYEYRHPTALHATHPSSSFDRPCQEWSSEGYWHTTKDVLFVKASVIGISSRGRYNDHVLRGSNSPRFVRSPIFSGMGPDKWFSYIHSSTVCMKETKQRAPG